MKRLLSILLAVLLALSLGITMVPAQSVEAKYEHKQGIVFHIKAEGQGTYEHSPPWNPPEDGSGEFSINLNGSGNFYNMAQGMAFSLHGGGGYVKGSFNGKEMDVKLQVVRVESCYSHVKYPNLPIRVHLRPKGFYDGVPIVYGFGQLIGNTYIDKKGWWIKPDATEMKVVLHLQDKNGSWHHITIYMDDSADIFQVDIDLVGY